MKKLSEEQAAIIQALVDLAEKWYNNILPQDDRVLRATYRVLDLALKGEITYYEFADKLSDIYAMVGVPVKVEHHCDNGTGEISFSVEEK